MSKIKSFRGKLTDGAIDTIVLHTNNGSTGYRIKRFDLMSADYGTATGDSHTSVVKIFKTPQTTADELIDFSDNTLMAAATFERNNSVGTTEQSLFFDNEITNQDIYVTHKDTQTGKSVNYYIELEQMNLDLNENTVATLKDIRNIDQQFDTTIN
tara:strand:- start:87 stop:551 length:465 start_codon:yes stop_codon:yes gene_type:complete